MKISSESKMKKPSISYHQLDGNGAWLIKHFEMRMEFAWHALLDLQQSSQSFTLYNTLVSGPTAGPAMQMPIHAPVLLPNNM
jgi:hypothetical protein